MHREMNQVSLLPGFVWSKSCGNDCSITDDNSFPSACMLRGTSPWLLSSVITWSLIHDETSLSENGAHYAAKHITQFFYEYY
jgi:hypothetical protein